MPTPPVVRGLPIVGSAFGLAADPKAFLSRIAARLGDVVEFSVPGERMVLVSRPELVTEVQRDPERFPKSTPKFLYVTLKHSMMTANGDAWRRQRSVFSPCFRPKGALIYADDVVALTGRMTRVWDSRADGDREFDASAELMGLMIDIAATIVVGADYSPRDRAAMVRVAQLLPWFNGRNAMLPFIPIWVPTPWNRQMKAAVATLDAAVDGIVAGRRTPRPEGTDLLSQVRASGPGDLGPAQLRDELIGLLLGSFESSYVTMLWALHLLTLNPLWQDRIHDEITAACGTDPATADAVPALSVTRRVIDETLRLFPAFPITDMRMVGRDDQLGGNSLRRGTKVVLSPWVTHRHAATWAAPQRFEPDNFLPERVAARPRGAYFPFGDGPRVCIGKNLALMELPLALASILQHYRVLPSRTRPEPRPIGIPVRSDSGLWIRLQHR
jgi:cytochrome P450